MVKQYEAIPNQDKSEEAAQQIIDKLRLIGRTAAFFGGYDGMKRLHDAAEALVGSDNSIGYRLNYVWDGIGGWWR